MKKLPLILPLLLTACPEEKTCIKRYDISADNGQCWKACAQSAASSRYYEYELNFSNCLEKACLCQSAACPHYTFHEECK